MFILLSVLSLLLSSQDSIIRIGVNMFLFCVQCDDEWDGKFRDFSSSNWICRRERNSIAYFRVQHHHDCGYLQEWSMIKKRDKCQRKEAEVADHQYKSIPLFLASSNQITTIILAWLCCFWRNANTREKKYIINAKRIRMYLKVKSLVGYNKKCVL